MTTLKAPKITAAEQKAVTTHKETLTAAIGEVEALYQKVVDLRKRERKFRQDSESLKHQAASFDRDSEIKLSATLRQLERVNEAILQAEMGAHDLKIPLWRSLDSAQELIAKICQTSYNELLDLQAAAIAPFMARTGDAEQVARTSGATHHLVRTLLTHNASPNDSIERLSEAAQEVLRKLDALLSRSVIWTFDGVAPISHSSIAAA